MGRQSSNSIHSPRLELYIQNMFLYNKRQLPNFDAVETIINRILGNRYYLHKLNIVNSPNCGLCNLHPETLTHLFYECRTANTLWN